jgi:hypothetical protein
MESLQHKTWLYITVNMLLLIENPKTRFLQQCIMQLAAMVAVGKK